MATIAEIDRLNSLQEKGVVGFYSTELVPFQAVPTAQIEVQEYLGMYRLPKFEAPAERKKGLKFHTCEQLGSTKEVTPKLSLQAYFDKSPKLVFEFYGEGAVDIDMGAATAVPVVGETATIKMSVNDGCFLVPLKHIDYANPIVQNLVVKNAAGTALNHGTDYEITRYMYHTAVKILPTASVGFGDTIAFDYEYTPFVSYCFYMGLGPQPVRSKKWFIYNDLNGVSVNDQDKTEILIFPDAEVVSDLSKEWRSCDNSQDDIQGFLFEIEAKEGTGVQFCYYQR